MYINVHFLDVSVSAWTIFLISSPVSHPADIITFMLQVATLKNKFSFICKVVSQERHLLKSKIFCSREHRTSNVHNIQMVHFVANILSIETAAAELACTKIHIWFSHPTYQSNKIIYLYIIIYFCIINMHNYTHWTQFTVMENNYNINNTR